MDRWSHASIQGLPTWQQCTQASADTAKQRSSEAYRDGYLARTREWKMILNETPEPELYRMNGGHVERKNLIASVEAASVRRDLERRLQDW